MRDRAVTLCFWDLATGLGGEDGEERAGDGGFFCTKIVSFI